MPATLAGTVTHPGWDKTNDQQAFLQTIAHESAHLYYFKLFPTAKPPSWYAESMATQLEGFHWSGKEWSFDRLSAARLPFVQGAMRTKKQLPLADLLGGNALSLINTNSEKALLFYAESWALFYYLTHTNDGRLTESFRRYREDVDGGGTKGLKEFLSPLAGLEQGWVKFVKQL